MSITACCDYLVSQIQGTVGAYNNTPMAAWTEPPAASADSSTPQAYVLPAEFTGKRQTMGGIEGYYNDIHHIAVVIKWAPPENLTDPNTGKLAVADAFANLIDTMVQNVRVSYTGAIFINDPVTQQQSQLLAIGQNITGRFLPPESLTDSAGQTWHLYQAQLIFEVEEKSQYVQGTNSPVVIL